MWPILNGTIVNVLTVAVGSTLGLTLAARVPDHYQRIILASLGLMTIMLGVDTGPLEMRDAIHKHSAGVESFGARVAMVVVGSLIVGAIIGTALQLHTRIERLGETIRQRFSGDSSETGGDHGRFAEGFLTASVIFCVGPLTLVGCLQNGTELRPDLLYIKACLDGFCSMALAATFGVGVAFSILTVLFFQGGLAVMAHYVATGLSPLSLDLMNVVGGLVLIATAFMILEIKKLPVADFLPGIFLPPLAVWLIEWLSPGTLVLG